MKIKYFYPDEEGNIKFTVEELEKLLNDVYDEGRRDGINEAHPYTTTPSWPITTPLYYNTADPINMSTIYCTDDNSIGRTIITSMEAKDVTRNNE